MDSKKVRTPSSWKHMWPEKAPNSYAAEVVNFDWLFDIQIDIVT